MSNKQLSFQDIFQPPFNSDGVFIWSSNGLMSLMATDTATSKALLERTCDILNGNIAPNKGADIAYGNGEITANGQPILVIRGWGRLIGVGGYNFTPEVASEIQDGFGNWVANKLSGN